MLVPVCTAQWTCLPCEYLSAWPAAAPGAAARVPPGQDMRCFLGRDKSQRGRNTRRDVANTRSQGHALRMISITGSCQCVIVFFCAHWLPYSLFFVSSTFAQRFAVADIWSNKGHRQVNFFSCYYPDCNESEELLKWVVVVALKAHLSQKNALKK